MKFRTTASRSIGLPLIALLCCSASEGSAYYHSDALKQDFATAVTDKVKSGIASYNVNSNAGSAGSSITVTYELFHMAIGSLVYTTHPNNYTLCYRVDATLKTNVSFKYGLWNMFSGTDNASLLSTKISVVFANASSNLNVRHVSPELYSDVNLDNKDVEYFFPYLNPSTQAPYTAVSDFDGSLGISTYYFYSAAELLSSSGDSDGFFWQTRRASALVSSAISSPDSVVIARKRSGTRAETPLLANEVCLCGRKPNH
jgi:hypothetical protein